MKVKIIAKNNKKIFTESEAIKRIEIKTINGELAARLHFDKIDFSDFILLKDFDLDIKRSDIIAEEKY